MAKGRMINQRITLDKKVNDLSCDTSRLAFTWLISFSDVEGRTPGDPAIIKSLLFPRRTDISVEQMETYIQEWSAAGLIIWYEAENDLWIEFPKFSDNQVGLRKDREAPSRIPAPELRKDSGVDQDKLPVNRTEKNRKETNTDDNVFRHYENNIGMMTPTMADVLQDAEKVYGADFIIKAIDIAVKNNARKWSYVEGILKKWAVSGMQTNTNKSQHVGGELVS